MSLLIASSMNTNNVHGSPRSQTSDVHCRRSSPTRLTILGAAAADESSVAVCAASAAEMEAFIRKNEATLETKE